VQLFNAGITVSVAAGNNADDASGYSPARAANAITVAGSTIADYHVTLSNYGAPVTVYGPGIFYLLLPSCEDHLIPFTGQDVISAWNDGGTMNMNGTSMVYHSLGKLRNNEFECL
jgi:subtilisin family serine protease